MNQLRILFAAAVFGVLASCNSCAKKSDPPRSGPTEAWLEGQTPKDTGTPTDGGTLVVRAMMEPDGLNFD